MSCITKTKKSLEDTIELLKKRNEELLEKVRFYEKERKTFVQSFLKTKT